MTDVTIVVATRNRRDQLLALLPRHTAPVIVVDNGSDDGTPDAVARAFPDVRVVPLGRNAGAGAVLTAALRRPGRVVREVFAETWRDPDGRAGLVDAARELGWVLRHRRRLPARMEADLVTLSRWGPVAAPAPLASTTS